MLGTASRKLAASNTGGVSYFASLVLLVSLVILGQLAARRIVMTSAICTTDM